MIYHSITIRHNTCILWPLMRYMKRLIMPRETRYREVLQFIMKTSTWPHGSFTAWRRQEKTRETKEQLGSKCKYTFQHLLWLIVLHTAIICYPPPPPPPINKVKIQARVKFKYERPRRARGSKKRSLLIQLNEVSEKNTIYERVRISWKCY